MSETYSKGSDDTPTLRIADGDPLADTNAIYPVETFRVTTWESRCDNAECENVHEAVGLRVHFEGGQTINLFFEPRQAHQLGLDMIEEVGHIVWPHCECGCQNGDES